MGFNNREREREREGGRERPGGARPPVELREKEGLVRPACKHADATPVHQQIHLDRFGF
jgi:hypothetical protein